jgi:L-asparaginase
VSTVGIGADTARLEPETFRRVMSADIGWEDVTSLADRIRSLVADGIDGVVVTQGTDTLEESAFLLHLLLDAAVPVVITGAMRNPGRAGADGPANLADAIRVACSPRAAARGVLVVLAGEIHRARDVRKMHTSSLAAFESPGSGPVGSVTEGRVYLPSVPASSRRPLIPRASPTPKVTLLRLSLGDDPALIDAVASIDVDGLVVEVYGAGHVGVRSLDALSRAAERMPVVFCSRTGAGALYRTTGDYPGSEGDLLRRGLIPADHLDGLKARLVLMALLASGEQHPNRIGSAIAALVTQD